MPFVLLAAAVIALPWYYGGATGLGHFCLTVSVALSLLASLLGNALKRNGALASAVDSKLTMILLGGVLVGAFQLVPLGGLQPWLAPTAHRWRTELTEPTKKPSSQPDDGPASVTTRSIYPAATRHCLGLLLVASAACLLAMPTFGGSRTGVALLVAGTISGVCLALFGMAQALRGVNEPFGEATLAAGAGSCFGPYVNRNNAGGFLNLCMACSVGLVAWAHWAPRAGDTGPAPRQRTGTRPRTSGLLAGWDGSQLLIWGAAIVIGAGVLATISRGSIVAFLTASIVTFILVRPWLGRGVPVWALFALAAIAIALVAWLGPLQQVRQRFDDSLAKESDTPLTEDGRVAIWKEALATWTRFAVWGSGLETYSYAHLKQQTRAAGASIAYHAENQFVQALSDAGLIGLGLLVAAIAVVARAIRRLAASGDRGDVSLAVAGSFALVSQIVGGSFDFGLYLPANALLMAVLCGAVCGRAASGRLAGSSSNKGSITPPPSRSLFASPWTIGLLYGWLCFGSLLAAWDFWQCSRIERWTDDERVQILLAARDQAALGRQIEKLSAAVAHRADDAEGNFGLSLLWLEKFRLQMFAQFRKARPWQDAEELWPPTEPVTLLVTQKQLRDSGAEAQVLQHQIAALRPTLDVAVAYANRAIRACPWDVRFHLQKATIFEVMGKFPEASAIIRRAEPWSGGNPEFWYEFGLLEFLAGNQAGSNTAWQRTLELSSQYASQIEAWRAYGEDQQNVELE